MTNIKKIFKSGMLCGAAALSCLSLSSCSLDDPENINTYTFEVLNLITPDDPDATPILTPGSYSFRLDGNKSLLQIETSNLLYNNVNYAFTTNDIRYSSQGFVTVLQTGSYVSFDAGQNNVSTGQISVTDLKGALNSTCYPPGQLQSTPVMSYRTGSGLTVRTLLSGEFYLGDTKLTQAGTADIITKDGVYQLVLNYATKTAHFAFGFLPLRDLSDKVSLTLKDLPLTLTDRGYTISAAEVIAEVSNNPGDHSWKFKDIQIATTDENLTRLSIQMTLADETPVTLSANVSYTLF